MVVALWVAYSLGRQAARGHVAEALANAHDVWHWQRLMHLPNELLIQHALLSNGFFVRSANVYYAAVHFPATAAFLVFLYLRRPAHYRWARRTLALLTGIALIIHTMFPLAPPRMLEGVGLIDTAQRYGPSVYGPPHEGGLSNQFAAMPSLHVGWATMVAIGLIVTLKSRWRWLWLAHPVITTIVVTGTANHYWLDSLVAWTLLATILALVPRPRPRIEVRPDVPGQIRRIPAL